jgi:hypothetical protein
VTRLRIPFAYGSPPGAGIGRILRLLGPTRRADRGGRTRGRVDSEIRTLQITLPMKVAVCRARPRAPGPYGPTQRSRQGLLAAQAHGDSLCHQSPQQRLSAAWVPRRAEHGRERRDRPQIHVVRSNGGELARDPNRSGSEIQAAGALPGRVIPFPIHCSIHPPRDATSTGIPAGNVPAHPLPGACGPEKTKLTAEQPDVPWRALG